MDIPTLQDRLVELNDKTLTVQAKADAENRDLTDAEVEEVQTLTGEFDAVTANLERRNRMVEQTEKLKSSLGRQTEPNESDEPKMSQRKKIPATPKAFSAGSAGFESLGHFALAVKNHQITGQTDPRLGVMMGAATTVASEDIGADGGFAVPPDFRADIAQMVTGQDSLLGLCDPFTTLGNTITLPVDETTPWGSTGVQGLWTGENQATTERKPILQTRDLKLNKLTCLIPITDELLEDAPMLDSYLRRKASEVLTSKLNLAILQGNGVGQPLGITGGGIISVAKETSQLADTILAQNIFKMYAKMYAPARANAVWVMNQSVEQQLFDMFVAIKNVAGTENVGGAPVYLPANTIAGNPYDTLMGKRIVFTEATETLGDKYDVFFANFPMGYLAAIKTGGIKTDVSIHLYFDAGVTAYRFSLRVGGMPYLSEAISQRTPSTPLTLSHFVTLDARA